MNELRTLKFPMRLGGHIGLDFVNTIEYRGTDDEVEFLKSYIDMLGWCWKGGLLTDEQADLLYQQAESQPSQAVAVYQEGLALREALYRIGQGVMNGECDQADLALLNDTLARMMPRRTLTIQLSGGAWVWQIDQLNAIFAPLLFETAELFASEQVQHLRQCPGCGWLFLDTSRNHQRRWCSMEICGSRAKSRRQYERKKSAV